MTTTQAFPKSVADQQTIRIIRQGNIDEVKSIPGDLVLKVSITADNQFKRDGLNITSEKQISIADAVLGCTTTV